MLADEYQIVERVDHLASALRKKIEKEKEDGTDHNSRGMLETEHEEASMLSHLDLLDSLCRLRVRTYMIN